MKLLVHLSIILFVGGWSPSFGSVADDIDIDSFDDDFDFEEEDDYEERLQHASAAAIARFTEGDLAGAAGQLVPIWKENPDHEGALHNIRALVTKLIHGTPASAKFIVAEETAVGNADDSVESIAGVAATHTNLACSVSHAVADETRHIFDLLNFARLSKYCGDDAKISEAAVMQAIEWLTVVPVEHSDPVSTAKSRKTREGDRVKVNFMLAELYTWKGDANLAFQALKEAHSVGEAKSAANAESLKEQAEYFAESFTPKRMEAILLGNDDKADTADSSIVPAEAPVFILGFPNSGAALVEKLIISAALGQSGKEYIETDEQQLSEPVISTLGDLKILRILLRGLSMDAAKNKMDLGLFIETAAQQKSKDISFVDSLRRQSKAFVRAKVDETLQKMNATNSISSPTLVTYLGGLDGVLAWLIPIIFPSSKIIWVERCAIDTTWAAYSSPKSAAGGLSGSLESLARSYEAYHTSTKKVQEMLASLGHPMLSVHFEDLIAKPEDTAKNIFEFVGLNSKSPNLAVRHFQFDTRDSLFEKFRLAKFDEYMNRTGVKIPSIADTDGEPWSLPSFSIQNNVPRISTTLGAWKMFSNFLDPLKNSIGRFDTHSQC